MFTLNIQDIWPIEEYAIKGRNFVWLIPPIELINKDSNIRIKNNLDLLNIKIIRVKGANFCQVDKIKQINQFIDCITDGNQK
jgi:hypothetical protein